ncbi:hypothetical protein [Actinomadura parmotrematis]|uniref:Oxidoreductase n=1 Tax=Actinomadura parmotrematis TaxID=2864039 RepID=A0ABS7FVC1_9ACTN|nr:hypothetical protein [Actinomadura parmotrematis]MBW8484353.1 hypothetical protein [Actinomadura parmotrematis]
MPYDDLTEAERAVWDAFPEAAAVDLGGDEVRAGVVAALLMGAREALPGRVPAVRVAGARVTGVLNLAHAELAHPLLMTGCAFAEAPELTGARTGDVRLLRCTFEKAPHLSGARVGGTLDLTGSTLGGAPALRAADLEVERDLDLSEIDARGELRLPNARVGGALVLDRARVANPGGVTLNGDGLTVERGLFGSGLVSEGRIRLRDARVGRRLSLRGARLTAPGENALDADQIQVDGTVGLDDLAAEGTLQLRSAAVQGSVAVNDARLSAPDGFALNLRLTTIGGEFSAFRGLRAEGTVNLTAADVRGQVALSGAVLSRPGGVALELERANVGGVLFCNRGFRADGEVHMPDARFGAGIDFGDARLNSPGGYALTAWGVQVGGLARCGDLTVDGKVSFAGARIENELHLHGAALTGALSLWRARIGALRVDAAASFGRVDLRDAEITVLDDVAGRWPDGLLLDGLVYQTLRSPRPVADRLAWLAKAGDGHLPQPYAQLAAVYRRHGYDADARTVLLAEQRRRRASLPLPLRPWGYLQDVAVGYGFRPYRAAAWLVALLAAATAAFAVHRPPPAEAAKAPPFNAFLYALDLLLPVISFGQESAFNPHGWQQWLAAALVAAGWILATTIIAGVSRNLSRP